MSFDFQSKFKDKHQHIFIWTITNPNREFNSDFKSVLGFVLKYEYNRFE